jgi:AcrR family transcriptional regulator
VGSFYARFAGKEELVRFLQDRIWTEARERWDAALDAEDWASLSISSVLEGVIGLLLTSYRADFRRRRALGRGWGGGERSQHFTTFHEHLLSTVIPLLLARERQITHPTPELGIRMGYRFAVGAIREVLDVEEVTGKQGEVFEDEELVRELARAWIGYLSPQALVGEEAEEDVDFFDPWG